MSMFYTSIWQLEIQQYIYLVNSRLLAKYVVKCYISGPVRLLASKTMVGSLLLLKMLHSKHSQCRKRRRRSSYDQEDYTVDAKVIKNEVNEYICRVCLKEGTISIYSDNICEALVTFGGIEVESDDIYPKFLCQECHTLLQGAVVLRKTAQQSDKILRQAVQVDSVSDNDEDDMNGGDSMDCNETQFEKGQSYYCNRCNIQFDTFTEYNQHILSEDHENMRLKCPICSKTYVPIYYKKHMALHKAASYMCDICGRNFKVKGQFARHRVTHFYKLPFACTLCPYKGRFSESLKMHMRTHTGEKPYQCAECASRFINKSNLNKHMLIHKGEHDFKCEACGRGFYTKRDLEMHIKVDHTGVRDHICNICGKAFGYRKQMMKHQVKVHKRAKLRSGRVPLYLQVESKKQKGEEVIET